MKCVLAITLLVLIVVHIDAQRGEDGAGEVFQGDLGFQMNGGAVAHEGFAPEAGLIKNRRLYKRTPDDHHDHHDNHDHHDDHDHHEHHDHDDHDHTTSHPHAHA